MPQNPHMPRGFGPNSYVGPCGGKHVVGYACMACEVLGRQQAEYEPVERDAQGFILPKPVDCSAKRG